MIFALSREHTKEAIWLSFNKIVELSLANKPCQSQEDRQSQRLLLTKLLLVTFTTLLVFWNFLLRKAPLKLISFHI